jgi:hypothetical protein
MYILCVGLNYTAADKTMQFRPRRRLTLIDIGELQKIKRATAKIPQYIYVVQRYIANGAQSFHGSAKTGTISYGNYAAFIHELFGLK